MTTPTFERISILNLYSHGYLCVFAVWKGRLQWIMIAFRNASWALIHVFPACPSASTEPFPSRSMPLAHFGRARKNFRGWVSGESKAVQTRTIAMDRIQWSQHIQTSSRYLHVFCKRSVLAAPRALYFELTMRTYDTSFMTIGDTWGYNITAVPSHRDAIAHTHTQKNTYVSYV